MVYLLTKLVDGVDISLNKSILLFFISFFSNTFSAISGGGAGLIQLPALMLSGVPYYQAIASHKLATVALGIGGSLRNYKSLGNDRVVALQILSFGLPGVILGALLVKYISEIYLNLFLGIISILLALYSFSKSDLGLSSIDKKANLVHKIKFFFSLLSCLLSSFLFCLAAELTLIISITPANCSAPITPDLTLGYANKNLGSKDLPHIA